MIDIHDPNFDPVETYQAFKAYVIGSAGGAEPLAARVHLKTWLHLKMWGNKNGCWDTEQTLAADLLWIWEKSGLIKPEKSCSSLYFHLL